MEKKNKLYLVGFLLVLLALPITVFMANKQQETRSQASSTVGEGSSVSCPGTDQALQNYNITVDGISVCSKKETVRQAADKAFAYSSLRSRMQLSTTLEIKNKKENLADRLGYTQNRNLIYLYNIENRPISKGLSANDIWKFIVVHEFFHSLYLRSNIYINSYPYDLLKQKDSNCFRNTKNGAVISTYDAVPRSGKTESFAESGALYIWDKSPLRPNALYSFRIQCPNSYKWFRDNIFN